METRQLLLLVALFHVFSSAKSQSMIGINYGQFADNLPPASATAQLLQSTTISKLRLYGADAAILQSLAGTDISFVLGVSNSDIPSLASDPSAAANWAAVNVLPYVPSSSISVVSVGNEALNSGGLVKSSSSISNTIPSQGWTQSAETCVPEVTVQATVDGRPMQSGEQCYLPSAVGFPTALGMGLLFQYVAVMLLLT